ncbi:MAG TPA: fibronectin type III domain-containing protein [Chryseolinea sp.]
MLKKLLFCWLLAVSSVALAQIPARPANLNATRTGDVYQITWTDEATDELNYQIDRSTDVGATFTGVAVLPANTNTYTDASIDPTKNYVYRVKALGDFGQSDFAYQGASTPLSVTCAQSLCYPETCTGFYPSETYIKTIETTCTDCVLGISFTRFSTYDYYDALVVIDGNSAYAPALGGYFGTMQPPTLISSGRSITFTFQSDLYNGSTGWQVSTQCIKRPGRPVITTDTHNIYSSWVRINWEDNSADETGFKLEYSKSPAFANPVEVTLPANTTDYFIDDLDLLTTYYFRVKAFNAQTESFLSNTYSATIMDLPKPVILSAAGVSSTSIKLVMPEMFSPYVKRYLYGSEDGIDFQFMGTHTETEFVHKNLASNHTYYYKAIFSNGSNYSEYSDVVQATTLSTPEITGANVSAVNEDIPFAISLTDLVLINAPGYPVDYNLFVDKGDHYDVKNGVITPAPNFNGTLSVPVKIASALDTSNVFAVAVTVLPVNDAPSDFVLLQPQNNSIVESPVLMKWQPAADVDGDPILYSVHITADGADQIVEKVTATELSFNIDDYPALWNTEVLWHVTASDSKTEVNSPPFSFRYVVTGIEETGKLEIYPNPVENSFVIRHLAYTAGPSSICDVGGTVVQSAQISRRDEELTVNVATLAPGVYFLRIMTSDGVKNYKFVKR